ncbi:hypothetical protein NPIL_240221 [Nephila pilipes]|uniref:Uncharacterized protein n=1 Tax=Nephila pilipes TaxID=299642 RepID=A0A8X6IJV5_NEPPI|nr:hypothetical protein NPIL_240221 [Nephila pilipes]
MISCFLKTRCVVLIEKKKRCEDLLQIDKFNEALLIDSRIFPIIALNGLEDLKHFEGECLAHGMNLKCNERKVPYFYQMSVHLRVQKIIDHSISVGVHYFIFINH